MVKGVGEGLGVAPTGTATVLLCKGAMELEGEHTEGCDGGGEPIFGDKARGLPRRGGEELGRRLDEVYGMIRRRQSSKRVGG